MRFAYIDSHGNEVPIPSVDALALRIELGAIGPDTELYDAQADHWGPASTHEIFHTLSRDVGEEGFMAPPPPVTPAAPPTQKGAPKPSPVEAKKESRKKSKEAKEAKPSRPQKKAPDGEFDLGLTLADPPPGPREKKERPAASPNAEDLSLDLSPPLSEDTPTDFVSLEGPDGDDDDEDDAFDFGGLGSGLELEDTPTEPAAPMDLSPTPTADDEEEMTIERSLEFGGALEMEVTDDLPLEQPMSAFEPDAPPGWMEVPGDHEDEVMDFSSVSQEVATDEEPIVPPLEAPARQRRTPRDRPSAPRFRRQRSLSGPIVFVVILLLIGVGGYLGWPILQGRLAQRSAPERPPVVMPVIPERLLPRMRSLAQDAIGDVVQDVGASTIPDDAPTEPDQEWLAGVYLGNASQFPGVEAFWSSIDSVIQGLRNADWQLYHDKFAARAEAAVAAPDTAAMLIERADSGFVAAEAQRADAYAAMQRLVDASLDLHDFLLQNEDNIEYQPANASTADPVLEAVPSTAALGDQMWGMVERITDALDALGSLDRVTRDRLLSGLETRLKQVGIQ